MTAIAPCLWFDRQAEQAANFYVSVFPNSGIGAISRYVGIAALQAAYAGPAARLTPKPPGDDSAAKPCDMPGGRFSAVLRGRSAGTHVMVPVPCYMRLSGAEELTA
jgi:hypothetical protein